MLLYDNKYAGYIIISDTLKDDAIEAIEKLKSKNIQTVMLTGDNKFTALALPKIKDRYILLRTVA